MSTPPKKRIEGGRVTPKGGPSGSRYNAPISPDSKTSPTWVAALMFGLLLLGIVIIFFNYVGWMPGGMKNVYLMLGLGCILGGIVTATQLR
jgi:hypothetical protein